MIKSEEKKLKICLFGAGSGSSNLGVNALFYSILSSLFLKIPDLDLVVFDFGRGIRKKSMTIEGNTYIYKAAGSNLSKKLYRSDSAWNMFFHSILNNRRHPFLSLIYRADGIMDITGGDSFTEIYGPRRFRGAVIRKKTVLNLHRPLILLPQTYGPFLKKRNKNLASNIIRKSSFVWARDVYSFQVLKEMAGSEFSEDKYKLGVDCAFSLPACDASSKLPEEIKDVLKNRQLETVGLNISGLIWNNRTEEGRISKKDYRRIIVQLINRVLEKTNAVILLIPHVLGNSSESDVRACFSAAELIKKEQNGRILILPKGLDERETKWVIGRTNWFCGTRLHSTIAAVSQGIPCVNLAYSMKAKGVFQSVNQEDQVIQLGDQNVNETVDLIWASFLIREKVREELLSILPSVMEKHDAQWDEIIKFVIKNRDKSDA
ncbi:MAG: polysaccharide pyruvyl transferase family protein [bacterium]